MYQLEPAADTSMHLPEEMTSHQQSANMHILRQQT